MLIIGLTQSLSPNQSRQQLLKKYHEADRLFKEGENIVNRKDYTEEKEEKINNDALASFKNLQTKLREIDPGFDSLSFFINFKIGILEHYFDNFTEAKKSYSNAIDLRAKLPVLADSFFFKPYLFFYIGHV